MSVTLHFIDGSPDAVIASGIDAGPFGYKDPGALEDNGIIEIRNSSQRVAEVVASTIRFLEISN